MNGTVSRKCDPEETDRNEDTANLAHDKPEFRPNGTVLLDFFKCESAQACQFWGIKKPICLAPVPKWLRQPGEDHTDTNSHEA